MNNQEMDINETIDNEKAIQIIIGLTKIYPNDGDLGKEIRKFINKINGRSKEGK